jgi:hypothetical protein
MTKLFEVIKASKAKKLVDFIDSMVDDDSGFRLKHTRRSSNRSKAAHIPTL